MIRDPTPETLVWVPMAQSRSATNPDKNHLGQGVMKQNVTRAAECVSGVWREEPELKVGNPGLLNGVTGEASKLNN